MRSPTWSERGRPRGILPPLAAALALLGALPGPTASPPDRPIHRSVVLLSIDGMRFDFPARSRHGGFDRMAREGVRARRLDPPFPASTFPAHATLATGCYPERHGILNSRFEDLERGKYDRSADPDWIACEPVWVRAERSKVRSAVSNWTGSYGAWRGVAPAYHDERFEPRGDDDSFRRVLAWLSLPAARRPRLVLAYLSGPDHAGHAHGPESAQVTRRIRAVDRQLDGFLRDLEALPQAQRITVLVVSDHGMAEGRARLDPGSLLRRNGIRARILASGGSANLYLSRGSDADRALRLLRGIPGLEAYPGGRLHPDLRYEFPGRTGDLVLVAGVGTDLGRGGEDGPLAGLHGYRGTEPQMGGIFFAWGSGVRRGEEVVRVRALDIAPLVARLLGIPPPRDAQGRVPPGILTPPR